MGSRLLLRRSQILTAEREGRRGGRESKRERVEGVTAYLDVLVF